MLQIPLELTEVAASGSSNAVVLLHLLYVPILNYLGYLGITDWIDITNLPLKKYAATIIGLKYSSAFFSLACAAFPYSACNNLDRIPATDSVSSRLWFSSWFTLVWPTLRGILALATLQGVADGTQPLGSIVVPFALLVVQPLIDLYMLLIIFTTDRSSFSGDIAFFKASTFYGPLLAACASWLVVQAFLWYEIQEFGVDPFEGMPLLYLSSDLQAFSNMVWPTLLVAAYNFY